jgi:hypothetical protein
MDEDEFALVTFEQLRFHRFEERKLFIKGHGQ